MNQPTVTSSTPAFTEKIRRASNVRLPHDAARDLSSITLICNLEALTSEFCKKSMADRIETATKTTIAILSKLIEFSNEHFDEQPLNLVQEQIASTRERIKNHDQAIKGLSWLSAFKSLMLSNSIDPATIATYDLLGKSIRSTCATTFTEMLKLTGEESQIHSQISQSSSVFLEELKSVWM